MSAAEIEEARKAIKRLAMPEDKRRTRRFAPGGRPARVDARRSFPVRYSPAARSTSVSIADRSRPADCRLVRHLRVDERIHPPLPALPARLGRDPACFDFPVWHPSDQRHPRDARSRSRRCAGAVFSHGHRLVRRHPIGEALHRFNRDSSRRVLGQGAITLLITDGLERDNLDKLKAEMERLAKSSRRVIWVNPLLRFGDFAAKAGGIRTMLPYVDSFRPIHNLASMADLCRALSGGRDFVR